MVKPIQSLTADEVGRINRVHVVRVTTTAEMSSWDVTLYSLATTAPVAHDVLNRERDDADGISHYVEFVLARVGLRMMGALEPSGDPISRFVGHVEAR